jgi:hypothetical protein
MRDPKRYYLYAGLECHAFSKVEAVLKFSEEDDGMWVKYEDYARLKAEVERLTAEVNYRKNMDTHIKIMADQYTPAKEGKPSV